MQCSLFTTAVQGSGHITADTAPIHLSISCSLLSSLINKIPRYFTPSLGAATHSQPGGSNPPLSSREPWPQRQRCWLSCRPLYIQLQYGLDGHSLMRPTEPHHLQRAESQFWCPQTRHSPPIGCTLRFDPWISQTESVTRDNPGAPSENVCHFLPRGHSSHCYIRTGWIVKMLVHCSTTRTESEFKLIILHLLDVYNIVMRHYTCQCWCKMILSHDKSRVNYLIFWLSFVCCERQKLLSNHFFYI